MAKSGEIHSYQSCGVGDFLTCTKRFQQYFLRFCSIHLGLNYLYTLDIQKIGFGQILVASSNWQMPVRTTSPFLSKNIANSFVRAAFDRFA